MERIPGGKARGGRCPRNVDKVELAQGIKVELEHTADRRVAREIACDHLTEDGRYYSKLATAHLDGGRRRSDRLRDQERPEVIGYELGRETLTPVRTAIRTDAPGDYGAGPVGDGTFRMVPSGDIVDFAERNRRLGTRLRGADVGAPRARHALGNPAALTFTVLIGNELTGTSRYVGTFASQAEAQAYVDAETTRSRKFTTFEVWTGTPRAPRKPVAGATARGLHGITDPRRRTPGRRQATPAASALPTLSEAEHAEWVAQQAVTTTLRSRDAAAIKRAKDAHADAVEATEQAWWRLPAETRARMRETGEGPPGLDTETRMERAAAFKARRGR
jgi:hypothetical protein